MNISFACYQAISLIHGGPLIQVKQTKAELEKLGINVSFFNPWEFKKNKIDLVHIFSANLGTYHLAKALHDYSLPFVTSSIFFTQHSPSFIKKMAAANNFLKKIRPGIWTDYVFTQQICNWSEAVLPNTADEKELIHKGLSISEERITVIPNGVEPRFEFGDPSLFRNKYGVDNFILNVGHIGPKRKNVLNLIRAVENLNHPTVIIGKITESEYGKQCLKEAKENKNILIIDGIDNSSDMLASAYAACDVFALPSLFETPGIAALEAALAGAKIVITPYGGTKDYFKTMAHYTEPNSVESIRTGIISALNQPKNSILTKHIKKEFLWSAVARKTLQVYEKVMNP